MTAPTQLNVLLRFVLMCLFCDHLCVYPFRCFMCVCMCIFLSDGLFISCTTHLYDVTSAYHICHLC